jgi:hypothetical protein
MAYIFGPLSITGSTVTVSGSVINTPASGSTTTKLGPFSTSGSVTTITGSLIITGSNIITGSLNITGSATIDDGYLYGRLVGNSGGLRGLDAIYSMPSNDFSNKIDSELNQDTFYPGVTYNQWAIPRLMTYSNGSGGGGGGGYSYQYSFGHMGIGTFNGLYNTGLDYFSSIYAESIFIHTTNEGGTIGGTTPGLSRIRSRVVISDNNSLDVAGYSYTSVSDAFTANGRTHIFTVTGSMLARDGVSLGTKTSNQHYITGSTGLSGSLTLIGTKTITGSVFISGSKTIIGTNTITGSLLVSGPTTQTGNNTLTGNTSLSGSINISGSSTIQGITTMSGSLLVSGSQTFIGTANNIGDTTITGSVIISGSLTMGGTAQTLVLATSILNPSALAIHTFPTASYHGAIYNIAAIEDSTNKTTTYNILVASGNNKVANIQTYLIKSEGTAPTPTIATAINAGNIELRVTDTGTFTYRGIVQLF